LAVGVSAPVSGLFVVLPPPPPHPRRANVATVANVICNVFIMFPLYE